MTSPMITVVKPSGTLMVPPMLGEERLFAAALWTAEQAARTCYKSEDKIDEGSAYKLIRRLVCDVQHVSVIEHVTFTARIIGSRSMSHQLVRHRIAAYSQESQRYVDYSRDRNGATDLGLQIVVPPSFGPVDSGTYVKRGTDSWVPRRYEKKIVQFDELIVGPVSRFMDKCWNDYAAYLADRALGILAEDAREGLPNATKTEVVATFNAHTWRHVFKKRALNPRAQWQIKDIFQMLLRQMGPLGPAFFGDLLDDLENGVGYSS